MRLRIAAVLATVATTAQSQSATDACHADTLTAGFPHRWLSSTVGQITIRARNVETPDRLAGAAALVHRPTQLDLIASELGFAAGELVDSTSILESVRRLRRTSLFTEVLLVGTQCATPSLTDFTVYTRDAWSIRSDFRTGRFTRFASLSDVNLWGSGRTLAVRGEESDVRRAVTVSVLDPYLLGTHMRGALLLRNYADGRAWNWSVRSRDFTPADVWRGTLLSTQLRRLGDEAATNTHTDIERRTATIAVSRLVLLRPRAAWALELGAEAERANIVVLGPGPRLGKSELHRDFAAALVGLERRAIAFSSIDWLVPGQAAAELPIGIDGEMVFGLGHDRASGALLTHADGWVGGTARPNRNVVVTGDLWWSGYRTRDSLFNGSLRFKAATYVSARRGIWSARVALERLYNPDPDVFALSTSDPMLRTLAPDSRLAESALNVNLERSIHLKTVDRRWVADAALFATYSERARTVGPSAPLPQRPSAVILGIGLRRVLNQPTQAPLRLDIGRAIWRSSRLPDRWIIVLSTVPWINSGRMRDGLQDVR